jgi:hypothetical protein
MNKIVLDKFDLKLKLFIQLFIAAMLPLYNFVYESNFMLWGCYIGLFLTFIALTFKNRLAMSMAFIGTFFSCMLWCIDFICQFFFNKIIFFGEPITRFFVSKLPIWVQSFSFFHVFIPVIWIYYLKKWGYDPKALHYFLILISIDFIVIYLFTDPTCNINWVFLPTKGGWQNISPLAWLILEMALLVVFLWLPMHLIAMRIFKK